MGSVGAIMQFQEEFPNPRAQLLGVCLQCCEELFRRRQLHPGQPVSVAQPLQAVQHGLCGATTPIPEAEEEATVVGPPLVPVVGHSLQHLFHTALHSVGVARWEVCQHLGAIQPLPEKGVVWEGVDQVPAQFLCQKALDATATHDLGELC